MPTRLYKAGLKWCKVSSFNSNDVTPFSALSGESGVCVFGYVWVCVGVYVSVRTSGHACVPACLCTRGRLYEYTYTFNHTCAGPWNSFCALLGASHDPKNIFCGPQQCFMIRGACSKAEQHAPWPTQHVFELRATGHRRSSPTCHGRACLSVCLRKRMRMRKRLSRGRLEHHMREH